MNLKVVEVQAGHVQTEIDDVSHRAYAPSEKEVMFHQSPVHQAELPIQRASRSEGKENCLVELTRHPDTERNPPPKRSKIWTPE